MMEYATLKVKNCSDGERFFESGAPKA